MYLPLKAEATDLIVDSRLVVVETYENLFDMVEGVTVSYNVIDVSVSKVFKPLCIATRLKVSINPTITPRLLRRSARAW